MKTDYEAGEHRFPGTVQAVMGFEDGSGEGVGVKIVSSATVITTTATIASGLSTVSGAWVALQSTPSATKPSIPVVKVSGASIYITMYGTGGGNPTAAGTIDVYAKGNY